MLLDLVVAGVQLGGGEQLGAGVGAGVVGDRAQTGGGHLAQLLPAERGGAGGLGGRALPAHLAADVAAGQVDGERQPALAQQRPGVLEHVREAVVEGEDDARGAAAGLDPVGGLVQGDHPAGRQGGEQVGLGGEVGGGDVQLVRAPATDPVVDQHGGALAGTAPDPARQLALHLGPDPPGDRGCSGHGGAAHCSPLCGTLPGAGKWPRIRRSWRPGPTSQ